MAKNEIYPAAVSYLKDISAAAFQVGQVGVDNDYLVEDVKELSGLTGEMKASMNRLEKMIAKAQGCKYGVNEVATIWRDDVLTEMKALRKVADTIETKVDEKYWPIPTYVDLLFGI